MLDHQTRVLAEKEELDTKIVSLKSFIDSDTFKNLDSNVAGLLTRQMDVMCKYSNILADRIELF